MARIRTIKPDEADRGDWWTVTDGRGPGTRQEVSTLCEAAQRLLLAIGRRVGYGDPEDLVHLLGLERTVAEAARIGVRGIRRTRSNEDIGRCLGISKQAVAKRWPGDRI